MKTAILLIVLVLGAGWSQQEKPGALPAKIQGVDVYLYSTPEREFEVIQSGSVVMLVDCSEIITKSINKAAKAKADGVIIHFEQSRFDAIKYR